MKLGVRLLPIAAVRQRIADLLLARRPVADVNVGEVTLWPHQRDAVARLRMAIGEFGGALLADDVGTGKTFVALAIASSYAAPMVVAPAGLREGWRRAAARAGRRLPFLSFEALSRGGHADVEHDFVIVDEAHHCRNRHAKRYDALASLLVKTPALLLSATPIHNRRDELTQLLALFLGAGAGALDDGAIARCVVRRGREILGADRNLPDVVGPILLATDTADDCTPDAILALPPPVPAVDAGMAGALVAYTLLRQWASSQGALLAGIRRRLAFSHALAATLDDGRYPTRAELAGWTLGDDAQQLAMSALLGPREASAPRAELREAVAAHAEGLRALRRAATADPEMDRRRALRLREVWRAHAGERTIAFSQFAETVDAYWRELRNVPGTCALTARRARTAGGMISRADALGSFAPGGAARAGPADRINALLTTDLASEGLDLHDASVLVHLDLPWTPARLEQRVGRIVRPGSPHAIVHLYAMEPPIRAEALLDVRRRLATKLSAARATLGDVMPDLGLDLDLGSGAPTTAAERLEAILQRWRRDPGPCPNGGTASAVVSAPGWGWLALVGTEQPRLVGSLDDQISDDPAVVVELCQRIDALPDDGTLPASRADSAVIRAIEQLRCWIDDRRGAALAGVGDIAALRGRRRTLTSIARLSDAPASARLALAGSAGRALAAAVRPMGAGSEKLLLTLDALRAGPAAIWLDAVGRLAPFGPPRRAAWLGDESILALVVLNPYP